MPPDSSNGPGDQKPSSSVNSTRLCQCTANQRKWLSEAPHQEVVLAAFQAGNWRPCIIFTAMGAGDVLSKDSLRNTILNLNCSARPHLHFRLDGNGSRVCWEAR